MYQSKVCVQEFLHIVSDLQIQVEKSKYDSLVCKKISCTDTKAFYISQSALSIVFFLISSVAISH